MKSTGKWIGIILLLLMMVSAEASAQNGSCNGNASQTMAQNSSSVSGSGEGGFRNGACKNIRSRARLQILLNGIPVTITGTVTEALYSGQGLTVDNGTELVTIYGFGPDFYWDSLGIIKPDVGEDVAIDALEVTLSDGSLKIIAVTVTIGEDVVPLRDEDGRPLWRGLGYGKNTDS